MTKLNWDGDDHEAICGRASASRREGETDLKMKSQTRPRRITIGSLINVKGINVILHGMRLAPINRWTVLPYCSRWLNICFCVTLVPLFSAKPKVPNVIHYCPYINLQLYTEKYMIMLLFTSFLVLYMLHLLLIFIHICMLRWWRYVFHDLRSKIIISLGK